MTSAFSFAALALLCLFPAMMVLSAATGRDFRQTIITRLGLNSSAAKDVDGLISNPQQSVSTITVVGIVFLVIFTIGVAGTLQGWYERIYDQAPPGGWTTPLLIRVSWVVGLCVYLLLQVQVGQHVGPAGGHVLIFVCAFIIATLFWWWSAYMLLAGRLGWRELLPTGLATGIFMTGLSVFSSLLFSSSIVSDDKTYGPIGVVMVLISYLVGLGVVIHLGAVVGRMWNERHTPIREMT